jgi:THUMP domain-like
MIAYVSADELRRSPFTTAYEVLDVLPFAVKRLRSYLRERGIGAVTIKKRGVAITPEQLRGQLRLAGPRQATVVLTRIAGAPTVLVVEPVPR